MMMFKSQGARSKGTCARAIAIAALGALATGAAEARDLPDLTITRADLRATGTCNGTEPLIAGSVDVKNIGQGRGQIFTTREMIRSTVVDQPTVRGGDRFVNSMRPGEVVTVNVRIGVGTAHRLTGRHRVVLMVDPERVFKEESETNNSVEVAVQLDCP